MSDSLQQFSAGDVVMHALRPEWGSGDVRRVENVEQNGQPGQRLTIRFINRGQMTVHTSVARIVQAERATQPAGAGSRETESRGWLAALEGQDPSDALTELPEAVGDPFRSLGARLASTLDLYRFDDSARSLIDWAVAQTGMQDPLSEFTREKLQQLFQVFAQRREVHLRELVRMIKRSDEAPLLQEAAEHRLAAARTALRRAMQL